MADVNLSTEYIIAIALGSVLVALLLVFLCLLCVFFRKKRVFCFRRRGGDEEGRPFVLTDKILEERYGKKKRRRHKSRSSGGKGGKRKSVKYSRIGRSPDLRRPRGDPFAHNYLENPMADDVDGMGEDWSNPVFDAERSQQRDAAICIQSWFRMVR